MTANQEEQLEKIITQKWIACWPEGMEAWTEQRRTGYPKLFKVQTNNSNGTIDTDIMIRRLPFSQDDAKKDPEQYKNPLYGSWRCRQRRYTSMVGYR